MFGMVGFLKDLRVLTREMKSVTSITKGLGFLVNLNLRFCISRHVIHAKHTDIHPQIEGPVLLKSNTYFPWSFSSTWGLEPMPRDCWEPAIDLGLLIPASFFSVSHLHQTHNLWLWFYGRMQCLRESHKLALRGKWILETVQSIILHMGEAARRASNSKRTQYTSAQCLQQFRLLTEIQTMLHEAAPLCHSCNEVSGMTHTSEAYLHVQNV